MLSSKSSSRSMLLLAAMSAMAPSRAMVNQVSRSAERQVHTNVGQTRRDKESYPGQNREIAEWNAAVEAKRRAKIAERNRKQELNRKGTFAS